MKGVRVMRKQPTEIGPTSPKRTRKATPELPDRYDRRDMATQKAKDMGWRWNFPQLYKKELQLTETRFAEIAGVRRATVNELRESSDTYLTILLALYRGTQQSKPTATLHDLLWVAGQPDRWEPRHWSVIAEMQALPGMPGVYLNTPLLRREMVPPGAQWMSARALAAESGLTQANLWQMEHGTLQLKVSTLVRIYQVCLTYLPSLTLHDVLLITPESS